MLNTFLLQSGFVLFRDFDSSFPRVGANLLQVWVGVDKGLYKDGSRRSWANRLINADEI